MITRLVTWVRERRHSPRDDSGMTLAELLIASTLMVVLLTVVIITMSLFDNVATSVSSQYQELDQAIPALAPLQSLLRAQVEPAPTAYVTGATSPTPPPTPGFASIGNYSVTFYSNIGTAYNNVTSAGTTAGPAKIIAGAYTSSGSQATSCSMSSPCSFQVREFLPETNASGQSYCPGIGTTSACVYPSNYKLITDAQDVVNSTPIFSYSIFDSATGYNFAYTLTTSEVQSGTINLTGSSGHGYTSPVASTQSLTACTLPTTSYPTIATSCPLDNIQSVGIDLEIGVKGASLTPTSGTTTNYQNTVDNQTIVYRYAQSPGSTTYPYQYSAAVG